VHVFARAERWKEEVLLVREEMRRVGSWHEFHIRATKQRIEVLKDRRFRFERGLLAVLNANRICLEERLEGLSHWFKGEQVVGNLNAVRLQSRRQ
jgi:hypothetical protein